MKTQKGITLVALIITIVVLLILAVVSIDSIQNEGIMIQAQNAADTWNESHSNEQGTLGGYETILNQYNPNGSNVKKISFTIDETTYYAEEGMTWEVWVDSKYDENAEFSISGSYVIKMNESSVRNVLDSSKSKVQPTKVIGEGEIYSLSRATPVPY